MKKIRERGTDRLLDVIDFFASRSDPVGAGEIAAALGAPRSTIYRVTEDLLQRAYLEQTHQGKLVPGRMFGLLGLSYERSNPILRHAERVISNLATVTREVVELDVKHDWKQLILLSRSGTEISYRGASEGSRTPLPATASARYLLEGCSLEAIRSNISSADFELPTGCVVTPEALYSEVIQAASSAHWICSGLISSYVSCIAAPIRGCGGNCIAVVCLVVPQPVLETRHDEFVALTVDAAAELSAISELVQNVRL